jgi:hypothetical protein
MAINVATMVAAKEGITLKLNNYGRASLSDIFGDWVIYRNLEPLDKRVAGLKSAGYKMGLKDDRIPRKLEKEYAKAAIWFVKEIQRVRGLSSPIQEFLFIGDTILNDGQAYLNIHQESNWRGSCFIGSEKAAQPPSVEIDEATAVYSANRWSALSTWLEWTLAQGFRLDAQTAVIVDIDKTALGAKGRNDQVIDQARLQGIYRTMSSVLGEDFDRVAFEKQYAELNKARYHFLTGDNQDYLAYICLVLNTGYLQFDEVLQQLQTKSVENFEQFVRTVDYRLLSQPGVSEAFRQVHEAVVTSVRVGDPTPFKRFRREEFLSTVEHMGHLADNTPVDELSKKEITLTQEVWEVSEWLQARNCMLLCLSDKPDESSCPSPQLAAKYAPVHKTVTHRVGISIVAELNALTMAN